MEIKMAHYSKIMLLLLIGIIQNVTPQQYLNITLPHSFDQAMISTDTDKKEYDLFLTETPDKIFLDLLKEKYHFFINHIEELMQESPKIPKIIHQIWIGPNPFPTKALKWKDSWQKIHPEWEYKLWTDADVIALNLKNKKYYDEAKNWGEKADILRYEILYRFGGVYVDVDFESLKPLDWLHHSCDFYAGIHAIPLLFKNNLRINNGIIGAKPQHPILKKALANVKNFRTQPKVSKRTGPEFFSTMIKEYLTTSKKQKTMDLVFPSNFFYPSGPRDPNGSTFTIMPGLAYIQPETLAVHYYTAFWIKPHQKSRKRKH
jgi:mannosyltransferase OCH1-like enzyme